MSIYLNTPQLMKLLELEPQHQVTLSKLAADAVAEQVLRKVDRGAAVQKVLDAINTEVIARYRGSTAVDDMVRTALEKRIAVRLDIMEHEALQKMIDAAVEKVVARKLAALLKGA